MWLAWRRSTAAVTSAAAAAPAACPPNRSSRPATCDDTGGSRTSSSCGAPSGTSTVHLARSAAFPLRPTRSLRAAGPRQGPPRSTATTPPPSPNPPTPIAATEPASVPEVTTRPAARAHSTDPHTADLLRSIARRGGGAVRPRPRPQRDARTTPSTAALAALLRPAAGPVADKSHSPAARHVAAHPTPPSREAKVPTAGGEVVPPSPQPSPPPPSQTAPPSRALLDKLLHTIRTEKRVHWDALAARHPEVRRLPLYECRTEWVSQQCAHGSATPMPPHPSVFVSEVDDRNSSRSTPPPEPLPPLLLCTAATGTGKSVLIPLFALDAHWAALEHRLVCTLRLLDDAAGSTADGPAAAFPVDSQAAFVREFTRCSRVCIVVSQPTRVACAELATYTSALLNAGRTPPPTSVEAPPSTSGAGTAAHGSSELVGRRVGFAVGGEGRFCAATEIVFATPGYAVSALQLAPRASSAPSSASRPTLSPTTLMVDEAHCRDLETDALLAWVQLSRASRTNAVPRLRQYYVMSATMHLHAMYAYLAHPAHVSESAQTSAPQPPVVLLLSPAQRAHVRRWWRTRGTPPSTRGASVSDAEVDAAVTAAVHADPDVRAAVLRCIEVADLCGDPDASADAAGPASPDVAGSAKAAALVIATRPHRVERFFVDDLDPAHGRFAESRVLFGDGRAATPAGAAATSRSRAGSTAVDSASSAGGGAHGGATSGTPLCLSSDGDRVRQQLCSLFGTRASAYAMQSTMAQALVTFVLQLLEAARRRWVVDAAAAPAAAGASSTPSASPGTPTPAADAPVTLLLFVAGLGELQLLLQGLERMCDTTALTASRGAPVLRHGAEVFSVGLLHSTAVGSPQEQLAATAQAGAPLRLLIATNVAESSLTIPNTRIVLDTCLERRVRADDVTGATLVRTSFVSPSGLRQRCGRVGRTGDGVVIHLAPRSFVLPEHDEAERMMMTTPGDVTPAPATHAARAPDALEPLPDGTVAVLLRMKLLFPAVSTALAALPSPPRASQARLALQQLADAELLLLPEGADEENADGADAGCDGGAPHLRRLLDGSALTAKGRLVASLPLPHENAALVYHGLQFRCVEDAVLLACAAAVPSLFAAARVSPYSAVQVGERRWTTSQYAARRTELDLKPALSPLEQFYRTLWVQRDFAGFAVPQETPHMAASPHPSAPPSSRRRVEHLSEPLMLRALLRQWYAFSNGEACVRFITSHGLNRSAVRQVDSLVAQCCGRLIRLLQQQQQQQQQPTSGSPADSREDAATVPPPDVAEDTEAEIDFGVYVSDTTTGATAEPTSASDTDRSHSNTNNSSDDEDGGAMPGIAFLRDWPDAVRAQVLRSLRRLHRVAQHRAGLRHSGPQGRLGLPQWHDSEEHMVRLWSRPYVAPRTGDGNADRAAAARAVQAAVRRHPCFAYWGMRISAQQPPWRYPSLYATHHRTSSVAVAPSRTVPPPLIPRVTQARLPAYRPLPPRPPPIPSVIYAMGRTEDRLCGAFVAAYGHRTLRGEDGGHRFHHRRLRRNLQALEYDEAHVCTFHVDLEDPHPPQPQPQPHVGASPALERSAEAVEGARGSAQPDAVPAAASPDSPWRTGATAELIRAALEPYLAGTGLVQLDVFQSRRLAVAARFARDGFRGLLSSHTLHSIFASTSTSPSETGRSAGNAEGDAVRGTDGLDGEELAGRGDTSVARGGADAAQQSESAALVDAPIGDAADAALLRPAVLPAGLRPEDVSGGLGAAAPPHHHPPNACAAGDTRSTASSSSSSSSSHSHYCHPFVQLAPFGVSLLVAATAGGGGGGGGGMSGLQRIPVPHTAMPQRGGPPASSTGADTVVPDVIATSMQPEETAAAPPLRMSSGGGRYGVGARDRAVRYADAVELGLEHLLPAPAAESVSSLATEPAPPPPPPRSESATATPLPLTNEAAAHDATMSATLTSHAHTSTSPPLPTTLSVVPPVYITHSITWKVPLPVAAPRRTRADTDGGVSRELPYCPLCNQLCTSAAQLQQHFRSTAHMEHLYHAVQLGLRGEHLAVLYGGTAAAAAARPPSTAVDRPTASSSLPLMSLLGAADASDAPRRPVAQHLHPCALHPQSFLNCLQMSPTHTRPAATAAEARRGGDRATPLAVAGSLVATQGAGDILPPPHLRTGRAGVRPPCESLTAHHVWVLNFASAGETAPHREGAAAAATTAPAHSSTPSASSTAPHPPPQQPLQPPPTAALCIVAGYLAAASAQAMVALLFNRTHTHLHGVMLYGLGVWRLPTPLPMQRYMGVLEHIGDGGGWPGLLVPLPSSSSNSSSRSRNASTDAADTQAEEAEACGVAEGLHWCAPAPACAMSAAEKAGDEAAASVAHGALTAATAARAVADRDAVVSAALLLVLHEYAQAQRSVVTVADYVERVLHKLRLASFVSPAGAHDAAGGGSSSSGNSSATAAAEVLVDFMQRARRGQRVQSLLRDLGCLFATPPSALAALMGTAGDAGDGTTSTEPSPSDVGTSLSRRLSHRALSSEGASLEMMFTVPPVLPSVLPPPDFAARLRRHYAAQHRRRWRRQRASATPCSRTEQPAQQAEDRRTRGPQPSRPTRRRREGRDDEDDALF